jgi:hypothetical protein
MITEEPEITLSSGQRVLKALHDWIVMLRDRGHLIEVSASGDVWVHPPCDEDLQFHLEASWSDTAAILIDLDTVH